MVMPFAWVGAGVRRFSFLEVGKESIFSGWEESIFLEKVSGGVEEEKESFVAVVGWEICAAEEEGEEEEEELEKEIFAFWLVVGRDFSSFYHEGKSPFGASEVMERHSEKGNVSAACLPHHSSHGISWAAHLLRWKRSQSQTMTAGSVVCTGASAAQNRLQPSCCPCLLQTQTAPLFSAWVLVTAILFSQYLYVLSLYPKFFLETQKHDFFLCGSTAGGSENGEFWVGELLETMACAFALEDLLKEIAYEFFEGG